MNNIFWPKIVAVKVSTRLKPKTLQLTTHPILDLVLPTSFLMVEAGLCCFFMARALIDCYNQELF